MHVSTAEYDCCLAVIVVLPATPLPPPPTHTNHQEHCSLPDYVEFKPQQPVDLNSVLSAASPDAMDLLLQLLVLRPDKRATAKEALRHPFFTKHEPKACDPSELALPIPEERKHKVRDGGPRHGWSIKGIPSRMVHQGGPVKAGRPGGAAKRTKRLTITLPSPTWGRTLLFPSPPPPRLMIHLPQNK